MTTPHSPPPKRQGLSRVLHAFTYSMAGLRAGWHEPAFRQEALLALVWHTMSPRRARRWAFAIGMLGLLLGVVQTVRGAHYPSHTAWTALVCAGVAWLNHTLFQRWPNGLNTA